METKQKVIIASVALATAFAAGRFTVPSKVMEDKETKTAETEKKDTKSNVERHKDKKTTTIEITRPDGTKERRVEETEITDTTKATDAKNQTKVVTEETSRKEVISGEQKTTVSALGMASVTGSNLPTYGFAVSKPVLGPLTVGVFGFANGQIGASMGLTF